MSFETGSALTFSSNFSVHKICMTFCLLFIVFLEKNYRNSLKSGKFPQFGTIQDIRLRSLEKTFCNALVMTILSATCK